jgi:surface antigen
MRMKLVLTASAISNGETQSVHGTACREPEGTWRIES